MCCEINYWMKLLALNETHLHADMYYILYSYVGYAFILCTKCAYYKTGGPDTTVRDVWSVQQYMMVKALVSQIFGSLLVVPLLLYSTTML